MRVLLSTNANREEKCDIMLPWQHYFRMTTKPTTTATAVEGLNVINDPKCNNILFLAKRRAARFIISSRAKRACITQASQGQRDFLLAINLSSLVGVRLDVIQSSDVKVHYGFPGNRLPSTTKPWVFFMRTVFFICEL